jgi:hypothetical protein
VQEKSNKISNSPPKRLEIQIDQDQSHTTNVMKPNNITVHPDNTNPDILEGTDHDMRNSMLEIQGNEYADKRNIDGSLKVPIKTHADVAIDGK